MILEIDVDEKKVDKDAVLKMMDELDFVDHVCVPRLSEEDHESRENLLRAIGERLYQLEDGSDPNCPLVELRGWIEEEIRVACDRGHKDWSKVMGARGAEEPSEAAPADKEEGPDIGVWTGGDAPKGVLALIGHIKGVEEVKAMSE